MRRKLSIFIIAFVFACLMWLYISLTQTYNIDYTIPLIVKLTDKQAITSDIPKDINVVLRGKGWNLLGVIFTKKVEYYLDLTNYKKDTRVNIMQTAGDVLNLPEGVSIISINPDAIDISFDNITEKMIKVKNNVTVTPKDGYLVVGTARVEPDSVLVSGAFSVLSKIKYIPTENQSFSDINTKFSKQVKLKDTLTNLISYSLKNVKVSYNVQLSADKDFENIVIQLVNAPKDKEVLVVPPKIKLFLRGGVEDLSNTNNEELSASIDYKSIEKDSSGYVVPDIRMPSNLILLKYEPEKFQYIIKSR